MYSINRNAGERLSAGVAFRRFARLGLDRKELSVFEAYEVIAGATPNHSAALDMLAVYDTMRLLSASGQQECAHAVRAVYLWGAGRRPRKNDVTYRIRRLAFDTHCDERTVYRRLETAKRLYAALRSSPCSAGQNA